LPQFNGSAGIEGDSEFARLLAPQSQRLFDYDRGREAFELCNELFEVTVEYLGLTAGFGDRNHELGDSGGASGENSVGAPAQRACSQTIMADKERECLFTAEAQKGLQKLGVAARILNARKTSGVEEALYRG
jgi:hypothetical protein